MKKTISAALIAGVAVASLSACELDTATAGGKKHHDSSIKQGKPGKPAKSKPDFTVAQQNAIESAQSYLDMSGFSRAGLIGQLSSKAGEGFKMADAVFAVNHLKVDWNKEAVQSAKSYLDMSSFSRSGLIQQLSSPAGDQFTQAQAVYAANHVGL